MFYGIFKFFQVGPVTTVRDKFYGLVIHEVFYVITFLNTNPTKVMIRYFMKYAI